MADIDPAALGARAEAMIKALAPISAEPKRLVRLFLSPEHRRAADLVAQWMGEAGLAVSEDALGTVRGRAGEGPRLLIGSHLDSVIDAGHYDGPLGVILGIVAAAHFGGKPPVPIDVLAFGDEEGSRFPSTLTSSAACAGAFDPAVLTQTDRQGIRLADAITAYGKDPADIAKAAYARGEALAYLELHIEQGPVLEREGEPLGIVTGLVGQYRVGVRVTGQAGHAGTVPMGLRHDALAGAAEMVLMVERTAKADRHGGLVATVGRIEALPGATNVIPATVSFTIDLRHMDDGVRAAALAAIRAQTHQIAAARRLSVMFEHVHAEVPVACDAGLQDRLAAVIGELGYRALRLPSGAGHDAQMMVRLCPSAMLFVRCRGGISHSPAEFCSPPDMGIAAAALIRFIERFAQSQ